MEEFGGFISFLRGVKERLEKAPGSNPGFPGKTPPDLLLLSTSGFYPIFPSTDGWEKSWIWENPGDRVNHGMGTCGEMVDLGKLGPKTHGKEQTGRKGRTLAVSDPS